MKRLTLRHVNNGLSGVVIVTSLYIILAPLWPQLTFWWTGSVVKDLPPLVAASENPEVDEPIPTENTLVIPSMRLQEVVHEGRNNWVLSKGIWRLPRTSAPDKGGNTVMSGHRFTYGGPAVFYHLDKVKKGDQIILYWQQKKYQYRVEHVRVVPPTSTEVMAATDEPMLTIYTCTPLVTAKDRLVVQAKLEEAP